MSDIISSMPDSKDDFTLLQRYHEEWVIYRDQIQYLPGPFRPLEEDYLNRGMEGVEADSDVSIVQILLIEWFAILDRHQKRLCEAALDLIKQERQGQIHQHQQYIVSLKESFFDLSKGQFKFCNFK